VEIITYFTITKSVMQHSEYREFVGNSTVANGKVPIHQFKSNRSGLRVAIAEIDGPIVMNLVKKVFTVI
jgi:hypothetical protein